MKTSHLLCLVLAIALGFVTWKLVSSDSTAAETASAEPSGNEAYDCIMTRSSCRSFTDARPTEEQIDSLLQAAMAAPTARNARPWQIVVITDREILDTIASTYKNIKMAAEAPMAFVACGDLTIANEKGGDEFWDQDLSAVTENILLAAHSMGYGAVWCGIYPIQERVEFIQKLLDLPKTVIPLSVIPIGQPKNPLSPKDKFDRSRVHYNGW